MFSSWVIPNAMLRYTSVRLLFRSYRTMFVFVKIFSIVHLRRLAVGPCRRHAPPLIDRALDSPAQRARQSCPVAGIRRRVRHLQLHARALHARVDRVEELLRDLADVGARGL